MDECPGARCVRNSMGYFLRTGSASIDLAKEFARIIELRFELREHLFANGIAASADARADGGNQIVRAGNRMPASCGQPRSRRCASRCPASLHEMPPRRMAPVGNKNRNAIGGLNGEKKTGLVGYQPIGLARLAFRPTSGP